MVKLYFPKTRRGQNNDKFCLYRYWYSLAETCFFIAGFILFSVNTASCQLALLEKNITIPKQTTTVYGALNLISQSAECLFIYDSENVPSDKRVKLQADNLPLQKVLDNILSDPGLAYKVMGKHILIYRKDRDSPPPSDKVLPASPGLEIMKNIVIRGHIYDSENKEAIPYATVGIVEENIGTITNSDGFFLLKIPDSLNGTSLVVSHLGYLTRHVPVRLLSMQQVDIGLSRRVISIQEVIIRYVDPNMIIEKAMDQRRVNNAIDPVYLTTFYREGVQKNNKFTGYSEAVFKVYKSPYDATSQPDQVKLLKSRKIQSSGMSDTVFLKLKAGVQSALQLDIAKSIPGFLDLAPPVEYTYGYSNLVSYNEKDAYAVAFVQNAGLRKALYKGTVYIEKEDFAVLGASFEINPAGLDLAAEELVLKKSHRLIVKLKKITYSVTYMPFNGRYYLSHARCDMELTTRLRHHIFTDHFNTFLELATCHIDTSGVVKFPKQEVLEPGIVFQDQPYNSDDAFWGDFNTIAPEAKLSEALKGIIGKIEEVE
jgi:hypothetical protein